MNDLMIKFLNNGSNLLKNKTFKTLLVIFTTILLISSYYLDQIIMKKSGYFLLGITVVSLLFIRNDKKNS